MLSILLHLLQICLVLPGCQTRSISHCSFVLVLSRRCAAHSHSLTHTYMFNMCRLMHSHVPPHIHARDSDTRTCSQTSPQAACMGASTKCSGIHRCAYIVIYRNTLSRLPLRHSHINIKVHACLKMPSLKEIYSFSYRFTTQAFTCTSA